MDNTHQFANFIPASTPALHGNDDIRSLTNFRMVANQSEKGVSGMSQRKLALDKNGSGYKAAQQVISDRRLGPQIKWNVGVDLVNWSEKIIEILSEKDAAHLLQDNEVRVCLTKQELITLAKHITGTTKANNKRNKRDVIRLNMTISQHQSKLKSIENEISTLSTQCIVLQEEAIEEELEVQQHYQDVNPHTNTQSDPNASVGPVSGGSNTNFGPNLSSNDKFSGTNPPNTDYGGASTVKGASSSSSDMKPVNELLEQLSSQQKDTSICMDENGNIMTQGRSREFKTATPPYTSPQTMSFQRRASSSLKLQQSLREIQEDFIPPTMSGASKSQRKGTNLKISPVYKEKSTNFRDDSSNSEEESSNFGDDYENLGTFQSNSDENLQINLSKKSKESNSQQDESLKSEDAEGLEHATPGIDTRIPPLGTVLREDDVSRDQNIKTFHKTSSSTKTRRMLIALKRHISNLNLQAEKLQEGITNFSIKLYELQTQTQSIPGWVKQILLSENVSRVRSSDMAHFTTPGGPNVKISLQDVGDGSTKSDITKRAQADHIKVMAKGNDRMLYYLSNFNKERPAEADLESQHDAESRTFIWTLFKHCFQAQGSTFFEKFRHRDVLSVWTYVWRTFYNRDQNHNFNLAKELIDIKVRSKERLIPYIERAEALWKKANSSTFIRFDEEQFRKLLLNGLCSDRKFEHIIRTIRDDSKYDDLHVMKAELIKVETNYYEHANRVGSEKSRSTFYHARSAIDDQRQIKKQVSKEKKEIGAIKAEVAQQVNAALAVKGKNAPKRECFLFKRFGCCPRGKSSCKYHHDPKYGDVNRTKPTDKVKCNICQGNHWNKDCKDGRKPLRDEVWKQKYTGPRQ